MLPEPGKPLKNELCSAELFSFQNKTALCGVGDVQKDNESVLLTD